MHAAAYARLVSTLVLGPQPQIEGWLARRRALGQDGRDEVWEGVYHVTPHEPARNGIAAMALAALLDAPARVAGLVPGGSFNLGEEQDFRVPDLGYHRGVADVRYVPTAALVVEVLAPHDETFAKFDFYARHGVDEVWVVDPVERTVRCWQRHGESYERTRRSDLLGLDLDEVAAELVQRLGPPA